MKDVDLTPVDPETRFYAYDPIGNRRTSTEGSVSTTYSSNNLNQYTALSGAKSAAPLHDDDGNVTDYKTMKYSWNAENQMISAEPKNPAEGDTKTEYLYDYMGRRVRKQVFSRNADNSGWNATPDTEKLFVYDGWNLIKEITKEGASSSDKFYVWGLDLSQSLQGAGGIGGLVCAVQAGEVRHFFFDGNGNVGQVVNETGSIAAHYEYDPFGNALVADGSYTAENPFRFSTKYFDAETGLYYYIFRYYSAELGRWWSRDPAEEGGGVNLYGFIRNNGITFYDYLGLSCRYYSDEAQRHWREANRLSQRIWEITEQPRLYVRAIEALQGEINGLINGADPRVGHMHSGYPASEAEERIAAWIDYYQNLINQHKRSLTELSSQIGQVRGLAARNHLENDLAELAMRNYKSCMRDKYGQEEPPCGQFYCRVFSGVLTIIIDVASFHPAMTKPAMVATLVNTGITVWLCQPRDENAGFTALSLSFAGASWGASRFLSKEILDGADIASKALTGIDIGLNSETSIDYGLIKMYFAGDYSCE